MARHSKHREHKVINAVKCPVCGAPVGVPCIVNPKSQAGRPGPIVHTERRKAWQAWREQQPKPEDTK